MGFSYIFAGFVFLFNPNYNIIDILPDFIGYALIIYGMVKLRDMAPALSDARRYFIWLMTASLLKTLSVYLVSQMTDQGYLLVFTFVFTLVEVALMYMAFNSFFDGLFFAGTLNDATDMLTQLNSTRLTTMIFLFFRGIFTLLPEFVYLYVDESVGYVLASYKGVLNVISIIVSLVTGIIWIVAMKKFIAVIKHDEKFMSNLETRYREYILPDHDMFLKRSMKSAMTFFTVGTLFLCDFYIDGIDLLPDPIGALLILFGILTIRKYLSEYKPQLILSAVMAGVGIADWIYVKWFAGEYYTYGISRSVEGYRFYLISIASSAVRTIVMAALVIYMFKLLDSIIKNHTGRKEESEFQSVIERDKRKRSMLRVKSGAYLVFGLIAAASCLASTVNQYLIEEYWLINLLVSVIWVVVTSKTTFDINYGVEEKYM